MAKVVCQNFCILVTVWMLALPCIANDYRLPKSLVLKSQQVNLHLEPGAARFSGSTSMLIEAISATKTLAYHSRNLNITKVELVTPEATTLLPATPPNQYELVQHPLSEAVSGSFRLNITFTGQINETVEGLFERTSPLGKPYIFSQFQETDARSAFPSFDDPEQKAVFQFALTIPKALQALHNTQAISVEVVGEHKRIEFAQTSVQNTDVLALAVGDFDAIALADTRFNTTFYFPKGLDLQLPSGIAPLINNAIASIEAYTNAPFPYAKLDFFVAPIATLAAMENIGLVALNPNQIPDASASPYQQCFFKKLLAHEIAHMWFGNAITMKWYDDFWMNESFAEFIAAKVVRSHYPSEAHCTYNPQNKAFADDLPNARKLKAPVKLREDIEAIGQLAYTKGHAILAMQERALGEAAFRRGMRAYVQSAMGGNTSAQHYLQYFSDYPHMTDFAMSFLQQAGYPLLTLHEDPKKGLVLSQRSFHAGVTRRWHIPITIKEFRGQAVLRHPLMLSSESLSFQPKWQDSRFFIDAGGVGYFRYLDNSGRPSPDLNRLDPAEKASYLENASALAAASILDYADYLSDLLITINTLAPHSSETGHALGTLIDTFVELIPNALLPAYQAYLQAHLPIVSHWPERLEGINGGLWLSLYGIYLGEPQAVKLAKDAITSNNWQHHPHRLAVLRTASMHGTMTEYQGLLTLFAKADTTAQEDLLDALGYVASKEQVLAFYGFLLTKATEEFVIDYRFQFPAFQPRHRAVLADFLKRNKARIAKRISRDNLQWMPYNFITSCSLSEVALVQDTFATWLDVPGLSDKLDAVAAKIESCATGAKNSLMSIKTTIDYISD